MRAFHNDPAVKTKYLNRVRWHRQQDNLIQGTGWESESGRGCAIGCTLESYDHSRYPAELGLPEWLARMEDRIFEGLPAGDATQWPERFLTAIPVGADVEPVRHKLAIRRMDRLIELQTKSLDSAAEGRGLREAITQTLAALRAARACHEAGLGGNASDRSAWSAAESARSAAWSAVEAAAESARSAAWSAMLSAESAAESVLSAESAAESARSAVLSAAWSAAESARSAVLSAESAAWSSRSAAESAARSAARSAAWSAWRQEADDLLSLLAEARPC